MGPVGHDGVAKGPAVRGLSGVIKGSQSTGTQSLTLGHGSSLPTIRLGYNELSETSGILSTLRIERPGIFCENWVQSCCGNKCS